MYFNFVSSFLLDEHLQESALSTNLDPLLHKPLKNLASNDRTTDPSHSHPNQNNNHNHNNHQHHDSQLHTPYHHHHPSAPKISYQDRSVLTSASILHSTIDYRICPFCSRPLWVPALQFHIEQTCPNIAMFFANNNDTNSSEEEENDDEEEDKEDDNTDEGEENDDEKENKNKDNDYKPSNMGSDDDDEDGDDESDSITLNRRTNFRRKRRNGQVESPIKKQRRKQTTQKQKKGGGGGTGAGRGRGRGKGKKALHDSKENDKDTLNDESGLKKENVSVSKISQKTQSQSQHEPLFPSLQETQPNGHKRRKFGMTRSCKVALAAA